MRYTIARWVTLGVALLSIGSSASGLTDAELKCQDAIAKTARGYFKSHLKAVSKCEDQRADGSLAPTVECRPRRCSGGDNNGLACGNALDCPAGACLDSVSLDAKTGDALTKAADKVEMKITAKCSDPVPSAVVLGLPCGTTAALSVSAVATCLVADAHGANAERLLTTVYDASGAIADAGVRTCQAAIAKESAAYAVKRQIRKRGCAKKLAAGKITAPCPDAKTRASFDKDLAKFEAKVLAACSAAQVSDPTKDFGFPCERTGAVTFANMTFDRFDALLTNDIKAFRCVAAAAAANADASGDTVYPMPDAAPFSYGVTAGDPTATAFIAWTRTGGPGAVTLEVATDVDFTTIVDTQSGLTPDAAADNAVKTEVTGLTAATPYFYRFTQGASLSRVGRLRTAPATASTAPVRFVWTGDSNAFFKPYTVLDSILSDDPDLLLYIGDTIYGDDPRSGSGVATVRGDYHAKYKENRDDAALRNALANFGTVSMWDDHEVTNDFYGTDTSPALQAQMTAGNQAFRDYFPLREDLGDPMQLFRNYQWGQAAEFFVIDARQYRDAQAYITEPACIVMGSPQTLPTAPCTTEISNPARTYLGTVQKAWLKNALLTSTATFKFVMNGPLISGLLFLPYDRWEGYAAERQEIIDFIKLNNIKNVIFLSTDIHALIVNDQVGNATPPIIREFVSGAIGMDPIYRELPASIATLVPSLPALFATISYFDIDRFNYGLIEATPTQATVTYRDVTGAAVKTFTVAAVP